MSSNGEHDCRATGEMEQPSPGLALALARSNGDQIPRGYLDAHSPISGDGVHWVSSGAKTDPEWKSDMRNDGSRVRCGDPMECGS